MTLLGYYKLI